VDEAYGSWINALGSLATPPLNTIGVAYMLAGGAIGSESDPTLQLPLDSDDWLVDPPHVMVVFPAGVLDSSDVPADHGGGGPWRMWEGTPYVHLMIPTAPVAGDAGSDLDPASVEWMSQNARSAGPEAAVRGATIIGWAAGRGSEPTVVQEGDGEWWCATDSPMTPINDPICLDREAWRWEQAFGARVTPDLTSPGIGYMLQGGAVADISDPFATEPPAGADWLVGGPHLMVFLPPGTVDLSGFPDVPSPGPWVHFAGTPFAHLMVPVQ
jgi:hypothetical protein